MRDFGRLERILLDSIRSNLSPLRRDAFNGGGFKRKRLVSSTMATPGSRLFCAPAMFYRPRLGGGMTIGSWRIPCHTELS